MAIDNRGYMIIISMVAVLYGCTEAHAMRCGTELLSIGEPQYQVEQACGTPDSQHVVTGGRQGSVDEVYDYYKLDGVVNELHFIDGHLYTINGQTRG